MIGGTNCSAGSVEHEEDVVRPALLRVALAQQVLRVAAHQQRQVRLLADEARVEQILVDHDSRHRQAQRRVAAGIHRDPLVGVDRRRIVVGGDADEARPLVARLVDEVRVRNLGVGRIAAPDEDQVRIEQVVAGTGAGNFSQRRQGTRVMVAELRIEVETFLSKVAV